MKRILAFVLLLIICAMTFTACQLPDELQSVIDKITGNEPTVDVVYDLDGAVKYLVETQYASWKKDNSTPSDVLLVPQVIVKRVSYKVTWTCESDILTITPNADGSSTIKMPRLAEEHNYSLIATVEDGNGNKETHQFDLVVPANLAGDAVQPVVGTGYYLQIEQNAAKKVLFFNGKPESESKTYRLAMTTNPSSAALVYVEAVEGVDGAYRLYFMNGDVKTYLVVKEYTDDDAAPGAGKGTLTWETETPAEYYTYDANAKTFIHTDADGEDSYYMGTYSTYETISVSNASYITGDSANKVDASQFPVRFVTPESVPSHTCKYVDEVTAPTCTADGYTTHTCSICGDSYTDSETTKLGHNFVDKVCTNCGETEHTCADANGDFVCDVTDCDKQVLPEAGATLTIEQALKLGALFTKDTYTSGKYYVTGVIDKITQETYGNMVLKDDKGNTLTIYGTYDATGEKKYGEMTGTKPVVGDTITVYGIIGYYSAPQLKNGWITAINPAEGGETPEQPGEGGGETPEQPGEGGNEGGETPSAPTTVEEILNALYALADGETLAGEFTLTGKITNLDDWNNPTIVVEGFDSKPVYCFKLKDDRFVVGATITVSATTLKNYKGTYELEGCTLVEITLPEGSDDNTGSDVTTGNAYEYTFVSGVFTKDGTVALAGKNWTLTTVTSSGDAAYFGFDSQNGKGFQFGKAKDHLTSMTLVSESFTNVTKIVINTSGAKDVDGSFEVYVGDVKVGDSTTLTSSATAYTFECNTALTGEVKIVYTNSAKAIYIKSIQVVTAE